MTSPRGCPPRGASPGRGIVIPRFSAASPNSTHESEDERRQQYIQHSTTPAFSKQDGDRKYKWGFGVTSECQAGGCLARRLELPAPLIELREARRLAAVVECNDELERPTDRLDVGTDGAQQRVLALLELGHRALR